MRDIESIDDKNLELQFAILYVATIGFIMFYILLFGSFIWKIVTLLLVIRITLICLRQNIANRKCKKCTLILSRHVLKHYMHCCCFDSFRWALFVRLVSSQTSIALKELSFDFIFIKSTKKFVYIFVMIYESRNLNLAKWR